MRGLAFTEIDKSLGRLDSVVMFGNNFGLFGNYKRARWPLRSLKGITSPDCLMIANATDPYHTENSDRLEYHQRNRDRGRMGGQLRIRLRHRRCIGPWFDYLFVSKEELEEIVDRTGWRCAEILQSEDAGYIVILEKG